MGKQIRAVNVHTRSEVMIMNWHETYRIYSFLLLTHSLPLLSVTGRATGWWRLHECACGSVEQCMLRLVPVSAAWSGFKTESVQSEGQLQQPQRRRCGPEYWYKETCHIIPATVLISVYHRYSSFSCIHHTREQGSAIQASSLKLFSTNPNIIVAKIPLRHMFTVLWFLVFGVSSILSFSIRDQSKLQESCC